MGPNQKQHVTVTSMGHAGTVENADIMGSTGQKQGLIMVPQANRSGSTSKLNDKEERLLHPPEKGEVVRILSPNGSSIK